MSMTPSFLKSWYQSPEIIWQQRCGRYGRAGLRLVILGLVVAYSCGCYGQTKPAGKTNGTAKAKPPSPVGAISGPLTKLRKDGLAVVASFEQSAKGEITVVLKLDPAGADQFEAPSKTKVKPTPPIPCPERRGVPLQKHEPKAAAAAKVDPAVKKGAKPPVASKSSKPAGEKSKPKTTSSAAMHDFKGPSESVGDWQKQTLVAPTIDGREMTIIKHLWSPDGQRLILITAEKQTLTTRGLHVVNPISWQADKTVIFDGSEAHPDDLAWCSEGLAVLFASPNRDYTPQSPWVRVGLGKTHNPVTARRVDILDEKSLAVRNSWYVDAITIHSTPNSDLLYLEHVHGIRDLQPGGSGPGGNLLLVVDCRSGELVNAIPGTMQPATVSALRPVEFIYSNPGSEVTWNDMLLSPDAKTVIARSSHDDSVNVIRLDGHKYAFERRLVDMVCPTLQQLRPGRSPIWQLSSDGRSLLRFSEILGQTNVLSASDPARYLGLLPGHSNIKNGSPEYWYGTVYDDSLKSLFLLTSGQIEIATVDNRIVVPIQEPRPSLSWQPYRPGVMVFGEQCYWISGGKPGKPWPFEARLAADKALATGELKDPQLALTPPASTVEVPTDPAKVTMDDPKLKRKAISVPGTWIVWSPDGKSLLTGFGGTLSKKTGTGVVRRFDTKTWTETHRCAAPEGADAVVATAAGLVVHTSPHKLVNAPADAALKKPMMLLLNYHDLKPLAQLNDISRVAGNPAHHLLAGIRTAGDINHGDLVVIDLKTRKLAAGISGEYLDYLTPLGRMRQVQELGFHPDGEHIQIYTDGLRDVTFSGNRLSTGFPFDPAAPPPAVPGDPRVQPRFDGTGAEHQRQDTHHQQMRIDPSGQLMFSAFGMRALVKNAGTDQFLKLMDVPWNSVEFGSGDIIAYHGVDNAMFQSIKQGPLQADFKYEYIKLVVPHPKDPRIVAIKGGEYLYIQQVDLRPQK